jgi:hypothetical protein
MIGFLLTKDTAVLFFARTALEIKSSVERNLSNVRNDATQTFYKSVCLKSYFEPKMEWKQRNPFK